MAPPCPLFGRCGGCNLQHIAYPAQLVFKTQLARESLERMAGIEAPSLPMEAGEPYSYRNRVQIHPAADGGLGFMAGGTEEALRAKGCPIAVPEIDQWLRRENRKSKPYRELAARIGQRDRFVVFAQDGRLSVEGETALAEARVGPAKYLFPLGHFFQSNLAMAERLVDRAVKGLSGDLALDLYSGAGLFAARLASSFGQVVCVESDPVSLEAARSNLPRGKGRFHAQDVESWVSSQARQAGEAGRKTAAGARFDWIFVDPPRAGLSPKVRGWLKTFPSRGLSYVSCDQATLARDLGDLIGAGWSLDSLELYDFYPQTGRLEALAKLLPPSIAESKEI